VRFSLYTPSARIIPHLHLVKYTTTTKRDQPCQQTVPS
jgi:hypothetical protein